MGGMVEFTGCTSRGYIVLDIKKKKRKKRARSQRLA